MKKLKTIFVTLVIGWFVFNNFTAKADSDPEDDLISPCEITIFDKQLMPYWEGMWPAGETCQSNVMHFCCQENEVYF